MIPQRRSCEEHIFAVISISRNRLCNKRNTYVADIDAEKASDKINRFLLLIEQRRVGVTDCTNLYKLYTTIQNVSFV